MRQDDRGCCQCAHDLNKCSSRKAQILSHFRDMKFLRFTWLTIATLGISCSQADTSWRHWQAPSSIRSLDVLTDDHVRYAGAQGWAGQTTTSGDHWQHVQWTAPDSTIPSFRSSAFNGEHWFAASIASPAWIAKCAPNGLEPTWVHHDTSAAVFLDAMAWWNSQEGLVFGDPVDSCLTLLITRDGGHSWAPTSCDLVPAHTKGEAGFAASNGNICIQGDTAWVLTGGVVSRCLKSTDRGTTWRAIDLPIRQGESMTGVFGASFTKGGKGLAIGGHWEHPKDNTGNLIVTSDGGEHWSLLSEGEGPGYRSCIQHHPHRPEEVVACGFDGIDISTDGGAHWVHVSDSGRYVARFSPSGRTLWLAGNRSLSSVDWSELKAAP